MLSYVSDITLQDDPFVIGMDRFINLEQEDDFIGKAALTKIKAEGPKRRLVGIEISGAPLAGSNEHYWPISNNGEVIGHVTRCVYSPRLEKNIGWANLTTENSTIGTEIILQTPDGERPSVVCEAPWMKPQIKIPPLD